MSEYQRYEFMTIDRPLTSAQLDDVNELSSHIEASPSHASIEYQWGDFKHDPIQVLYEYFDAFLYWANWGSPRLAFRFPHGVLPANILEGYDLEDFVTFKRRADHDILDFHFAEMEAPNVWTDYELAPLIPIRDELMEGDLRSLYIVWLAARKMTGDYDEDEDYEISIPPVPPAFSELTAAQLALAELFRVPEELIGAAASHSESGTVRAKDDFVAWIRLLSPERQNNYLVRLANNEPGLSRQFIRELRELGRDKTATTPPTGQRIPFATLLAESSDFKAQLERARREQEQAARLRHLQDIHDHQDTYWQQIDMAAARGTGTGYDEATRSLIELREAANQFDETLQFNRRFSTWVQPHLHRPALLKRLQAHKFPLPGA